MNIHLHEWNNNRKCTCSMKGAIKEANPKVFNNNSVVQVFDHQKCFEKRGANYTPDGLKKITQLHIANKNLVVDF